jgi:hypothetical protein
MAGPGVGAKGFIGFGPETTWGTAVTPTRYIEFLSESLKRNQSGVVSNGIQPYRGATAYKRTTIAPGGDIAFEMCPEDVPTLIYHVLGGASTSGSSIYTHTLKPAVSLPTGLTFEIDRDVAYFIYEGSKINTFSMSFAPNEIITGSASVISENETGTIGASGNTPSYSSAEPFTGIQAAVEIDVDGGNNSYASQGVMAADFSISNDIFAGKYELGGNKRAALMEQKRSVTGKLNIEFDDLTLYNLFVNGTSTSLRITLTSDQLISGSTYHSMTIVFPKIVYTGETPVMGGPGIITVDCPFTALYTSAALPEIIVTVVNSQSSVIS